MKKARDPKALGEAITAQLSYRKLGKLAQCSHSTPYLLVQGKATSNELATRIARALGRPVDELFESALTSGEQVDVNEEAVA